MSLQIFVRLTVIFLFKVVQTDKTKGFFISAPLLISSLMKTCLITSIYFYCLNMPKDFHLPADFDPLQFPHWLLLSHLFPFPKRYPLYKSCPLSDSSMQGVPKFNVEAE